MPPIGTVISFNANLGYGFVQPADGSDVAFVHGQTVAEAGLDQLAKGQELQYDLVPGMDGKSAAENIKLIE